MMPAFWKAVALFAWRRWVKPGGKKPTGVPGNRDPDHPCDAYEPRKREMGDWGDCLADGHYLCAGCAHLDMESEYAYAHGLAVPPPEDEP